MVRHLNNNEIFYIGFFSKLGIELFIGSHLQAETDQKLDSISNQEELSKLPALINLRFGCSVT